MILPSCKPHQSLKYIISSTIPDTTTKQKTHLSLNQKTQTQKTKMPPIAHLLCFTISLTLFFLSHPDLSLAFPSLPEPDPLSIQPFHPNQTTPTTIPAFPEQSDLSSGCPLDLPDELFRAISSTCSVSSPHHLSRSKCCPALAAWLYSAYSATALGRAAARTPVSRLDLPLLPDDSETCVENLEKALKGRGIQLQRPNETCDVVYCYCGIRLHPLSCPEAFSLTKQGRLIEHDNVKVLERDCLNKERNSSIAACSKCLKSLYKLNQDPRVTNTSRSDRKSKMHSRDCHFMGLTWLLSKNRTAYIPTVTSVIRALMMNTDGSDLPKSCSLASDGMPLAVDSAELDDQSSSITARSPVPLIAGLLFTTLSFVLF